MTVASPSGNRIDYTIATWFGEDKAVRVALEAYERTHDDSRGHGHVDVIGLGPVAADESGVAKPGSTDLLDRDEW